MPRMNREKLTVKGSNGFSFIEIPIHSTLHYIESLLSRVSFQVSETRVRILTMIEFSNSLVIRVSELSYSQKILITTVIHCKL